MKTLILGLFLTFSAQAATIDLTDINGTVFQVDESTLQAAFYEYARKNNPNADAFYTNTDGSVTVINPRFMYKGIAHRIFDDSDSLRGLCLSFGLSYDVIYTAELITKPEDLLRLGSDGNLYSFLDSVNDVSVITDITCQSY